MTGSLDEQMHGTGEPLKRDDLMPDGWPRYSLFAPGTITYHGGGWWSKPSTGSIGSVMFSGEYDCNPVCGCHLASKCGSCNVCTNCDGCYCYED